MIPIICVVGRPDSGKTTLIGILIRKLRNRGYKIATIKHSHKDARIDTKGKDTWKHAKAGAETVVLSSPRRFTIIKNIKKELQLDEISKFINDADLIIAEGYKDSDKPKIAVINSIEDLSIIKKPIFAVVSRKKIDTGKIPCLGFNDTLLINIIEEKFLKI